MITKKRQYSPSNVYIQNWANDIQNNNPQTNTNYQKGEAVFNYVFYNVVKKWHVHYNTACPIEDVANYHEANCAETARIVYNLCLAVGIPFDDVRYMHSESKTHYWVEINGYGDKGWVVCDPSRAYANHDTHPVRKFGDYYPAVDAQNITEGEVG